MTFSVLNLRQMLPVCQRKKARKLPVIYVLIVFNLSLSKLDAQDALQTPNLFEAGGVPNSYSEQANPWDGVDNYPTCADMEDDGSGQESRIGSWACRFQSPSYFESLARDKYDHQRTNDGFPR